ncbi:MAG TPA: SapC family protein [Candidatus Aquabacterium excrementipullorum]|nr:SapC family protein [Candidatus Aquabacterium excrementipullorum]
MKTMLMYERLTPVNRDQHRSLRVKASGQHLSFARETNSLLLAVTELPLAALDLPCVFVASGDQHTMVAVVGLRDKENLYIDPEGRWDPHSYLPAFIRRYPFVLAEQPGTEQLTVCVDEAFDGLNPSDGEALFTPEGKDTPYLQQLQKFLLDFHNDMQRTTLFAKRLNELGLLVERNIDFKLGEQHLNLNGFKVVDEDKLRQLAPEVVQELFTSGALGWIHAHLLSLNNVSKLGTRLTRKLAN